jgi:hypothetical protein
MEVITNAERPLIIIIMIVTVIITVINKSICCGSWL